MIFGGFIHIYHGMKHHTSKHGMKYSSQYGEIFENLYRRLT